MRKKKERAKELEGIDMSNIVSSSRRRSTTSLPPPKPVIPVENEGDDVEDSDNDDDDDDDEDDEEDGNESQSEEDFEEGESGFIIPLFFITVSVISVKRAVDIFSLFSRFTTAALILLVVPLQITMTTVNKSCVE